MEFALLAILLFVILFGIIEASLMMYDKALITNASREGARAAVVYIADPVTGESRVLNEVEIEAVVADSLWYNYPSEPRLVSFSSSSPTVETMVPPPVYEELGGDPAKTDSGDYITVTVEYPYTFMIMDSLLGAFGPQIQLDAKTRMRVE